MGGSNSNSSSSSSSSSSSNRRQRIGRSSRNCNDNNDETTNKRRPARRRLGPNTVIPSSFRIDISLLDISNDVQSDPEASHLRNRIQQHLRTVYSAKDFLTATDFGTRLSYSSTSLSSSPSSSDLTSITSMSTADAVRQHILRFLKTQDKYTAFVSILLKSQAFHEVYHNDDDDDQNQNQNVIIDEEEVRNNNDKGNTITNDENRRQNWRLRPIVDLPRTEYKKPYIPLPCNNISAYWKKRARDDGYIICDANNNNKNNDDDDDDNLLQNNNQIPEEDVFSFSISHQFPFVGMAQIIMHGSNSNKNNDDIRKNHINDDGTDSNNNNNKIMMTGKQLSLSLPVPVPVIVGLDIVTFDDEIIKRLYSSQEEFLDAFRDSFTKNEWEIGIQDPTLSAANKLKEFYVRWSMKEAYTKAIGIGMGLQYNTFEISLDEEIYYCNNDDGYGDSDSDTTYYTSMKSVWCRIVSQQQQQQQTNHRDNFSSCDDKVFDFGTQTTVVSPTSCFHGQIRFLNNKEKDDEFFFFYFLPLKRKESRSSSSSSSTVSTLTVNVGEGCACICVGPFQGKISHTEAETETVVDNFEEWRNCINISWTEIDQLLTSSTLNVLPAAISTPTFKFENR